ncbi:hypothetical protein KL930_005202 [Ogataea haglerorum]|uniref:TLDc domain-containing protein n=1 Tax=Ogataea haglerorum TaxID=1937702 RepID=A0AAN6HYU1_9ASCO|nr:uncharacterized protein KL911_005213 [Ogataea haglerorum]KAG7691572.1 hypothetical protein KL915_005122 [Ogataea haglerorum]KAG7702323.1 hypothetical protein KL914_005252 [Ogataea haglerorum]KAG7702451.1 hypothetical protein KL950_005266 [Ogataea haglerorum]KAG7713204.1 hypothetical protein KL913_005185 [Ogataea haglerorum]KAG7713515.1 hypothetical protein KL949_005264 [Ogataea haglerorum]
MGQSSSTESQETATFTNGKLSRGELESAFIREVTRSFQPIELMSLRDNLGLQELQGTTVVTMRQITNIIELPETPATQDMTNCISFLARFPNYRTGPDLNVAGVLKVLAILNPEKFAQLFGNNTRYFLMLIFLALSFDSRNESDPDKSEKILCSDDLVDVVYLQDKLQWMLIPQVQSFDGIEFSQYPLPASKLLRVLTLLLYIAPISLEAKHSQPLGALFQFDDLSWLEYEKKAMNLLRSFDLDLTSSNYTSKKIIFSTFEKIIGTSYSNGTMPNLLVPLHHLLDSLLYSTRTTLHDIEFADSRILTRPMLSQLATILPDELVFTRLKKLFVGAESGFSMRSMESKVFKWNAPTILLVSGKLIEMQPSSGPVPKNKKYAAFLTEYPRFHASNNNSPQPPSADDDSYTFMVYLQKPWKISNSECFGDEHSFIAQLSPRQIIYPSSAYAHNYAYFNTLGGGLGFGSKPPLIKNNVRIFKPGEVSLTIEAAMEIACFRHLAVPGTYKTGSIFPHNVPEFEISINITNLEVWGCGSQKELEEQKKLWEWENREAEARKKLNAMHWDDGRALLEMAGMIGKDQSGGSV